MSPRHLCLVLASWACVLAACGSTSSIDFDDRDGDRLPDDAAGDVREAGDATADTPVDGAPDVATPPHRPTHDCPSACGAGAYCSYPYPGGYCPPGGSDSGVCPPGCAGCPALPPPTCKPLPASCGGAPSCGCLLAADCSSFGGQCYLDADGDWVIACLGG